MRKLFLTLSIVLVVTGCGADEASDTPALDYPAGHGAVALTIETSDPVSADWVGQIRIYEEPTDFTAPTVDRRLQPLQGTRGYDTIYLDIGSYAVIVEIVDVDDQVVLSGLAEGIQVLPGLLTPVSIRMMPSGGLQVEVDINLGGRQFERDPHPYRPDVDYDYHFLMGATHRVEDVSGGSGDPDYQIRYYAFVYATTVEGFEPYDEGEFLLTGASIDELLTSTPIEVSDSQINSISHLGRSLTTAGEHLYVVGERTGAWNDLQIHRSIDGLEWMQVATISITEARRDYVGMCTLFVDNQFNLLCAVKDYYDGARRDEVRFGLVHAFSPDGERWSPLLPYKEDADGSSGVEVDLATHLGDYNSTYSSFLYLNARLLGPVQVGGAYLGWLAMTRREGGTLGEDRTYIHRMTSMDRQSWSVDSSLSFNPELTVLGESIQAHPWDFEVLQTTEGAVILYTNPFGAIRVFREVP